MKNKYILKNINNNLSTKLYSFILIYVFLFGSIRIFFSDYSGLIENIIFITSDSIFLKYTLIPLIIFSTMHLYDKFEKNQFLLIRMKTKQKYFYNLFLNIFVNNTILFVFVIMLLIIPINILKSAEIDIKYISSISSYNYVYLLFCLIKLYFTFVFLGFILPIISKIFGTKFGVLSTIAYIAFISELLPSREINGLKEFIYIPGTFLFNNGYYKNLNLLIFNYSLFVIIFSIIIYFIYKIAYKRSKNMGDL